MLMVKWSQNMHQIYKLKNEKPQCSVVKHHPRELHTNNLIAVFKRSIMWKYYLTLSANRSKIDVCLLRGRSSRGAGGYEHR